MKKIILSGDIGWEINAFKIRQQLIGVTGDLEIDLSSPGGDVFEGIEIFNIFKDYKRDNPDSQLILNIKGQAASMASYLSCCDAFDLVTIEDNSIFMIHNPWMCECGDYVAMSKAADFLNRLRDMMVPIYSGKSNFSPSEIKSKMDEETWLFGSEIVEAGFADEIVGATGNLNKSTAIVNAQALMVSTLKKLKEKENSDIDKKAVAIFQINEKNIQNNLLEDKPKQEKIMDINELKNKHSDVYSEVTASALTDGEKKERSRVQSLMKMKKKKDFEGITVIHERIDEGIEKGETLQEVEIGVMALLSKNGVQAGIESPGDLDAKSDKSVSGEKTKNNENDVRW